MILATLRQDEIGIRSKSGDRLVEEFDTVAVKIIDKAKIRGIQLGS